MSDTLLPPIVIRVERPTVTPEERYRIAQMHWAVSSRYVHHVTMPVTTYCGGCQEEWGIDGCPTVRALRLVYFLESENDRVCALEKVALEALSTATVRGYWDRLFRERDVREIRFTFTGEMVVKAGIALFDNAYAKMRRQLLEWIRIEREKQKSQSERMAEALSHGFADMERHRRRSLTSDGTDDQPHASTDGS
jgi:hypothetical protein